MVTKKPELIIFDLDDTLAPAEIIYDLTLKELGIEPNDQTFLKARQKVKENLPTLAPVARSRFLYLKTYLEMSHSYSAQKSLQLGEDYELQVIKKMTAEWTRLQRPRLFRTLRTKGYRLAVLSNETCRLQTRKLASFEGSDHFFEMLLTSEERGMEKPQPLLFKEMLQYFNLDAKKALMIGDSLENDIQPCLQLGIPCIQSLEFKKPSLPHAQSIEKLDQILDFL